MLMRSRTVARKLKMWKREDAKMKVEVVASTFEGLGPNTCPNKTL